MDARTLPDAESSPAPATARFRIVFVDVAPSLFIGAVDQAIVATALPAIAAGLGNFRDVAWVVTSYLLAATIAAPILGRLGDAYGRKRALLWALALFLIGSVACATAPTFVLLVCARAVQGAAGGGLMTLAQAIVGEAVSPRERGRFQGWFGAVFAGASTIGPVVGGVLSEHLGWRSVFWCSVPLGILATCTALRLKSVAGTGQCHLDAPGTLSFVGSTLALLLAVTAASSRGWGSPVVITLALAALCGSAALWRVERHSPDPLIPPDLLSIPVVWRTSAVVLLFAAVLFGAIVELPLFVQLTLAMTPGQAGMMLIPLTLAQVAISTATGLQIAKTGRPRLPMVGGLLLASIGLAAMALAPSLGAIAACVLSGVVGVGLGTTMPAAQTAVQWAAGPRRLGIATGMLSFARSLGGVLGAATAAAIFVGVLSTRDPGLARQLQTRLSSGAVGSGALAERSVLGGAFRWVFGGLSVLGFLAAAMARSTPDINLSAQPRVGLDVLAKAIASTAQRCPSQLPRSTLRSWEDEVDHAPGTARRPRRM